MSTAMPRIPSRQLRWRSLGGASGSGGGADDGGASPDGAGRSSQVGASGAPEGCGTAVCDVAGFGGAQPRSCRAGTSFADAGGEVMASFGAPHRTARRQHASGRWVDSTAIIHNNPRIAAAASDAILTVEAIPSVTRFMMLPPSARWAPSPAGGELECEFQRPATAPCGSCPAWAVER